MRPAAWVLSSRSSDGLARVLAHVVAHLVKIISRLLVIAVVGWVGAAAAAPTVFDRAQFLQSTATTPPGPDSAWQVVDLPDSWRTHKRDWKKFGWYRLTFTHQNTRQDSINSPQRAIYISRITNNIEVFMNGSSFALSGRLGPVPQQSWNFAQYHLIPASLMREGENEILIRLHPDTYTRAGIAQVMFGDSEEVRPHYDRRRFLQTTAPQLITSVLLVMTFFSLALWLRRRSETVFLLFGLLAASAVVRLFHHYLRDTPDWLGALALPALNWLTVLQVNFTLHYANRPMPRFERALIWLASMATVVAMVAFIGDFFWGAAMVIYSISTLLTPVLVAVMVYQLTRVVNAANLYMVVTVLLTTGLGIHDFLNYQEKLGFDQLYLIPLGLPFLLIAVAVLLVRRYVESITNYESLTRTLSSRVHARERELEASFARERILDQQRAAAEERQHLMRDMHDGIGSQLMSTLAVVKRGTLSREALETILADCIDELKLTIDSMEPVERDLLVVLGNLRYRLEPRLNAAGITLQWAVADLPPLDYLEPANVRSILRIVQEAFTNTLKHANAKRITLSTGVDRTNNRVLVRITDDGKSFDADKNGGGRGLANMRARAASLNGSVEIIALKGGGTCVSLLLPLTAPEKK